MSSLLERFNRPVVAILVITAVTGVLRFWDLGHPTRFVFDEVYYAKAGCIFIGGSDRTCRIDSSDEHYWVENKWDVGSWVHPPLGKWMIAMGIEAFGMDAFGWRFSSAVAGTLVATFVAVIAYLLFSSVVWTYVAGLLVAVEHLNHVQARVALLDVHLEFWVVLGFLFLVLDRRWIDRRTPEWVPDPATSSEDDAETSQVEDVIVPRRAARRVPSPIWRPWRFASGVALGASFAVKWSGITALAAAVVLTYIWETTRRARGDVGRWRAFGRALAVESFGIVLAFAIVPLAVYMITWVPWFNHFGWSPKAWWRNQTASWAYHQHLTEFALDSKTNTYTPTHPYYSKAWEWIPMLRPVSFYVRDLGPDIRQILSIGNPVLFWFTAWTMPYAAFSWWRRRDWRLGFIVVSFAMQWLPWMLVSRPQFFFYALPLTPFMILAAVYALRDLSDATIVLHDRETGAIVESTRHPYRPIVWAYLILAVGLFAWFWPVLVGSRLSDTLWRARVWFRGWI